MAQESAIHDIADALRASGVTDTTLSVKDRECLDLSGFLLLEDVIDVAWLTRLRIAFEAALGPGHTGQRQTGTRHVADLALNDEAFDRAYLHPKVLAAAHHILRRPFRVLHLSGRDPLPGFGLQGLHTDWVPRSPGEPFSVVTAIWLLDEFTEKNGGTRIVPGTHVDPRPLPKSMQAPESRHPAQKPVIARAGSVLIINGHLWHSGTRNETDRPRRVLQCQFVARDAARPVDFQKGIPIRLSPEARYILGV